MVRECVQRKTLNEAINSEITWIYQETIGLEQGIEGFGGFSINVNEE